MSDESISRLRGFTKMDAITPRGAGLAAKIDQHVGGRIRRRRVLLGFTQEQLADSLDISYQQIQKYETGANRVSAGRLYQISRLLEVSVAHFFDGLDPNDPIEKTEEGVSAPRTTIELVRNFNAIADGPVRTAISQLVKSLSQDPENANVGFGDETRIQNHVSNGNSNGNAHN